MPAAANAPTIGIVIPAYNEQDTIRTCVLAAIHQTVPAAEIIVVDNKSTDQTAAILRELQEEYPDAPLRVLHQDKAQGITPTRNMGFDAVTADVIGRIDSDSILEPNWVEETTKVFLDEGVHAATGPVIYYDMPLRRYMAKADDSARRAISRLVKQYHFLFGTNMALRRTAWEKVRGDICLDADKEMFEDIDLSVHLYDDGFTIVYAPGMVAGMSARRIDDSPRDFLAYAKRFDTTYNHHGLRKKALRIPQWTYLGIYPIAKSLRWGMKLRESIKL
jgi:cellulose synthase/poly-beta-1,6-N-acetylglucosamine synthase-like glycosyltransferase